MATIPQILANRANAKRSSGPRTAHGKQISSRNATTRGSLWSKDPTVGGESREEWLAFQKAVVNSWNPHGAMEMTLAEQIAQIMWRERRIAQCEAMISGLPFSQQDGDTVTNETISSPLQLGLSEVKVLRRRLDEEVENRRAYRDILDCIQALPNLPDEQSTDGRLAGLILDKFDILEGQSLGQLFGRRPIAEPLENIGVPRELFDRLEEWPHWRIGHLRTILLEFAKVINRPLDAMLSDASRGYTLFLERSPRVEAELRDQLQIAIAKESAILNAERYRRLFLVGTDLEKVQRAESHLSRTLKNKIELLTDLQDRRRSRSREVLPELKRIEYEAEPRNDRPARKRTMRC